MFSDFSQIKRFYKYTRTHTGIQPRPLDLSLKSWVTKRTGICVWICAHMYICMCMYVCVFITVFSLSSSVPDNSLSYRRGWLEGKGHVLPHRCICNPPSLLSGVSTSNIGLLSRGGAFEGSFWQLPHWVLTSCNSLKQAMPSAASSFHSSSTLLVWPSVDPYLDFFGPACHPLWAGSLAKAHPDHPHTFCKPWPAWTESSVQMLPEKAGTSH